MNNRRLHARIRLIVDFKLFHPVLGELHVRTRDVSDGGVFLILDNPGILAIGERVRGQVQGLAEDAPLVDLEVVRYEATGVGLRFVGTGETGAP